MSAISKLISSQIWTPMLLLERVESAAQNFSPTALNPAQKTYTPASSPPVSQYLAAELTGDSGTPEQNINLTSWEDTEGEAQNSTGKKVQELRIQADDSNAAAVTIEGGDSDPYELFGAAAALDVPPGGFVLMRFEDQLDDVGPAAKNIKATIGHGDVVTIEMMIG